MSRVKLTSHLGDLVADMSGIPAKVRAEAPVVVRDNTREGMRLAKANAKVSAGKHGKRYPAAFSAETGRFTGFGATVYQGEYGPDISRPQGGMSFEGGSRNQKPHLDLARSADRIRKSFVRDVVKLVDRLFW